MLDFIVHRTRRLLVAAVVAAALLGAGSARAQDLSGLGVAVEGASMGLLAPPLVADTVYVVKWRRPPLVWPVLSFVCGVGAVALGLGYALPNASSIDDLAGAKVGLGWGLVAEGGLEIGIGVWTLLLPKASAPPPTAERASPRWAIVPAIGRDSTGHPTWGAALTIGRF